MMERIFTSLLALSEDDLSACADAESFLLDFLPYPASSIAANPEDAAEAVLKGSASLAIEGLEKMILLDVRSFTTRDIGEPNKDRTLRGPHIGMNESLEGNLVQIRRYLRTSQLKTERFLLGTQIKNEVVILSMEGKENPALLKRIRKKLETSTLPNLSMTQETLAALLFPQKKLSVLNPFPRVRFTERPDVVAATLMEGKVAVLCDNSPSAMILPECLFDFFEETDDYYFPPITATYLRIVRVFVFLASIFLIPIWLLVVQYKNNLPAAFSFILINQDYSVPLFLQFILIEFAIDGLKMASLNTPDSLSSSFSMIGGLLLGEFAVKSGWFVPQTILYSAFTGIANFIPSNFELGYSFKFMRISLILLVEFLGLWGLLGGTLFWLLVLISTRSITGKGYLYPVFPFDAKGIAKIFVRTTKGRERSA